MEDDHADPARTGQLHHVELYASAYERAVEFWDWWLSELGYRRKNERESGRSRINDPTYIVLARADNSRLPFDRKAPGLNHLAFHADARDTVDELTAGVREREDATVLYEDRHPYAGGYYALYSEGPDGIKVEAVGPDASGNGDSGA